MIQTLYKIIICLVILSCNHPEGKKYQRNQGNKKESNSSNNEFKVNTNDNELQQNKAEENRNVLKMELQNGVRYVWIEINGIRLRFIFDTGASSICISSSEASVLYRQGTLQKEDILDVQYFQDATGTISEGTRINLKTVKIGERTLNNIEATIIDNSQAPLLLGQTAFEKFGKISIDNEKGEITFE
jgi:aspartyl protease family protein